MESLEKWIFRTFPVDVLIAIDFIVVTVIYFAAYKYVDTTIVDPVYKFSFIILLVTYYPSSIVAQIKVVAGKAARIEDAEGP